MLLNNPDAYQYWRDEKLANSTTKLENCLLEINNPFALNAAQKNKIKSLCQHNNFALFSLQTQDNYPNAIVAINQQLGLKDFDQHLYIKNQGLAHITQSDDKQQGEFIPYSNKKLSWHTDGYYNSPQQLIRAFSLFCVNPASSGGENQWIDPQMVYLLLRENNPDIVKALTHPQAMTIPEHQIDGKLRRAVSVGPIFFIDEKTSTLSMRYTQRRKNIEFFNSVEITQAVQHLDRLLKSKTAYHFECLLQRGQGLLCNNVLHKRSRFSDNKNNSRLLLRGRYFNRILNYN